MGSLPGSGSGSGPPEFPIFAVVGIPVVFILGLLGSAIPTILHTHVPRFNVANTTAFRFFSGFASGIVLAVGATHSLPDSFATAANILGPDSYPWPGLIFMLGALVTFLVEEFLEHKIGGEHHSHFPALPRPDGMLLEEGANHSLTATAATAPVKAELGLGNSASSSAQGSPLGLSPDPRDPGASGSGHGHGHSYGHSHGHSRTGAEARVFTEMMSLVFGLSFHSFFVGLALGLTGNDHGLFAAIVAHQFFEGVALGARVLKVTFKWRYTVYVVDLFFSIAAPVGTSVGLALYFGVSADAYAFGIVTMIFQALSGGVLVYVSLVHMLKNEMEQEALDQRSKTVMVLGFLLGAAALSLLAMWA